jgi:Mg-chelatase subunit ChlD
MSNADHAAGSPPPARHRAQWTGRGHVLRSRRAALVVPVLALALVAGLGGWWAASRSGDAPATAARSAWCPAATRRVAAAPEIAPVVRQAARAVDPDGGDCGPVAVTAEEPAVTADRPPADRPDVWIPSSSAWLGIATANGHAYEASGDALARSPLVVAAPEAIAGLVSDDGRTSWARIVAAAASHRIPAMTMADPLRSTEGLLSVHAVRSAMARTTSDAGIAQLRALTLRSRLVDAAGEPAALLDRIATQPDATTAVYDVGLLPMTEQRLLAAQRRNPGLVPAYPTDGLVEADYPFAPAAGTDGARAVLAESLAGHLRSAQTSTALVAAGFRVGDAHPAGTVAAHPASLRLPGDPDELLEPALQWSRYRKLNFQVLLLVDASGSMNDRITDRAGRVTTKADLLRESGANAAQLFGEDTSIGMWYFATPKAGSPAHTEAVPFGPISATAEERPRRDLLAASIRRYRAFDDAGTPLFRTVLDGAAAMQARAKRDTVTLVVVLTDGNDEGSRFAMSRDAFLKRLSATQKPSAPVPVFTVGYGPDADMDTLGRVAKVTGGQVAAAKDPADLASAMAKIFLAAHAPS